MHNDDDKNLESFAVLRGGMYGRRNPDSFAQRAERCKQRVQERVVAMLRQQVAAKDRALENVAAGVTNPTGEPVKLMGRLKRARRSFSQNWDVVIEPQIEALHEEYGREYRPGAHKPAA